MPLDDRHQKTSTSLWWIGLSVAFSVAVHALGLVLTRFTAGWTLPDEPLHSFVETAGSVTGVGVALLLVLMDRLGRGSSSNVPLVFGLGTMAVLDALHAVVSPGQSFVWLHSTATFAGGLLFASVWVSPRGRRGYVLNSTVAALLVLGALLLPLSPDGSPRMIVDGHFTWAAVFLNVGGGVLMLAAAGRYLWHYARTDNTDDLLFAVHCLLFGGAAIMFEQSALWDFSWWWWHMLRLIAYVVALTFAVRTVMELQLEVRLQAERAQSRYEMARSKAFEATNESERLREALDKHTLYSVTDRSGKIVEVNEGFCRISGYSREELLGKNHRIINSGVHPRSFWIEIWRTIAAGKAWRGEVCNRAKDGSLYWVDATMVPWIGPDGRPERYISLRFDITDAKRVAEERERLADKIAAQEQLLDTVINSVSDAIVAEDEDGNFLLFNQAATDLFVESAGVLAPTGWDELPTQYRADGETALGEDDLPTRRALRGEEVLNQDLVVRRGDGDRRVSCNATRLASDSHRGAVVSLRDVTEVEQMRRQLQQAQKLESIGQLAAGVAHEINTPLQSVIANVSFLGEAQPRIVETIEEVLRLIDPEDGRAAQPGAARELVEKARCNHLMEQSLLALNDLGGASRKVAEIVRAMKNVAHPGSVEHTYFDLNAVLRDAATITCNRWKGAAELTLELDEGLPNAFGSHAEISQVAINLIVNAADALEELHGESGDSGEIVIRSESAQDGSAVFRIADNGAGIPAHIVARVFDPFFTTKEVGKGSGQGLAISYDIVTNRHNGSIKVDSRPGDGAEFTITLPTAAPVAEGRANPLAGHLDSASL